MAARTLTRTRGSRGSLTTLKLLCLCGAPWSAEATKGGPKGRVGRAPSAPAAGTTTLKPSSVEAEL